ncbi:MAG: RNA methyltransferase [Candidatus Gastranaerophilales bacterium]|nr:RNA methyltransferase [Candidatus Gastranaerophilales bacterium]
MHYVNPISNSKIKEIQKLHQKKYRQESGLFLAEGIKSVEECLNEQIEIKEIYVTENVKLKSIPNFAIVIPENIMKKISTTDSVCEILAVAKKKIINPAEIKKRNKLALFENISDPGNLGTILRSASAFGIDAVILFGNCVELYSPKVIRSAVGNFFKTPVILIHTIEELNKLFPEHKKISTALSIKNNISLKELAIINKYIIMFGAEAGGLSKDLINISCKNARLDMAKNVESLNLSVSAAIVFYELFINAKEG